MLPLAMLGGGIFYSFFNLFAFLTPYLISVMLLITCCRLSIREMRFTRLHAWMLMVQVFGSVIVYGVLCYFDRVLAEAMMICVLAPTAVAAAVITGMLGGSVPCLATYTLASNLCVAIVAPVMFSLVGVRDGVSFGQSVWYICTQVGPLLLLPLAGAWVLEYFVPSVHKILRARQSISFYLWSLSLTIVTGRTVFFIMQQDSKDYGAEILMAIAALVLCIAQFALGRRIGKKYGETIAGGQGLGQKNTILAIWMAQVYLSPLSSIGPAAYVLWQNSINAFQLYRKRNTAGGVKDER
nr:MULTISPECIES: transporter [Butyricimonas]